MTPAPTIRLLAENLPEHRILEAIFLPERESGTIEISSYLTSSAALGAAEMSLMLHPEVPVALILNADTNDPAKIDDRSATIRRILSRITPFGWHVTLAVPDLDTWVQADSRVKEIFDSDEATKRNRYERAARIRDLARQQPLDRDAIGTAHPEFQELLAFLERHAQVPLPSA